MSTNENPRLSTDNRTPAEPITTDGWYSHTDGTVGLYGWGGRPHAPRIVNCRSRIPTPTEQAAEDDADDAEYREWCRARGR